MKQIDRQTDRQRFRLNESEEQTERQKDRQTDFASARSTFLSAVRVKCVRRKEICFQFRADRATDDNNKNKNYVEVKKSFVQTLFKSFLTRALLK